MEEVLCPQASSDFTKPAELSSASLFQNEGEERWLCTPGPSEPTVNSAPFINNEPSAPYSYPKESIKTNLAVRTSPVLKCLWFCLIMFMSLFSCCFVLPTMGSKQASINKWTKKKKATAMLGTQACAPAGKHGKLRLTEDAFFRVCWYFVPPQSPQQPLHFIVIVCFVIHPFI